MNLILNVMNQTHWIRESVCELCIADSRPQGVS